MIARGFRIRTLLFLLGVGAVLLAAQAVPEVEIAAEPSHHLAIENQDVRVFYVEVAPHADTLMHWHRHDYIYVTLGAAEIVNEVQGKEPVTVKLPDGETRFSPGPFAHLVRNVSGQPFRNVTVELLQDDKLRGSTAKWDEERGVDVLQGGTKQVLFVKDGVRVTKFELQPGGVVPMHHHNGPHLLVAVSDLEIRSDVEGQGPMPGHFKSGESKWLPGGYSHTVTNVGKDVARFVTMEFP